MSRHGYYPYWNSARWCSRSAHWPDTMATAGFAGGSATGLTLWGVPDWRESHTGHTLSGGPDTGESLTGRAEVLA